METVFWLWQHGKKDASREMGTDHSTEELKGYPSVLVWALSAATVTRYKAIKVII